MKKKGKGGFNNAEPGLDRFNQPEPVQFGFWTGSVRFFNFCAGSQTNSTHFFSTRYFPLFFSHFSHFFKIIQNLQNKIKSVKNLKNTIMTSIKLV